jgi:ribosome maturation factor RimP
MKVKKVRVVDLVTDIFDKIMRENNLPHELVDVEFIKEGKHRFLRVYIDVENGVTLEDCQTISHKLNEKLDTLDPIEEEYILEVSSPGIERPLKKEADFLRFVDKLAQLKLYFPINGAKIIEGHLKGFENGEVLIEDERSQVIVRIPKDKIASAKLLFRF